MVEEEGIIFRRHKEWLESLGVTFSTSAIYKESKKSNDSKEVSSNMCYNIKVLANEKEANIIVTDKNLGEKLESFLNKHNFFNYIMSGNQEDKIKYTDRNMTSIPAPVVPVPELQPSKRRIIYDRDFLLNFRYHKYPTPRVIEAIQKNHMHLFR